MTTTNQRNLGKYKANPATELRDKLVQHYLPLVGHVARRVATRCTSARLACSSCTWIGLFGVGQKWPLTSPQSAERIA